MRYGGTTTRLILATVCATAALVLPLFLTPVGLAVYLVRFWGYWAILGTCLLFAWHVWRVLREIGYANWLRRLWTHWPAGCLILASTIFLHLHIDRGFQILYDEHALSSTAMSLYFEQEARVQSAAHILDGHQVADVGFVDKRPTLFPFAVSTVHRLTGYRPENVFWLNSALTLVFLALLYAIGARICGRPHGMLLVLLAAGFPLLAQNTNGGGYEILNLCLICTLILSGIHFLRSEGSRGLDLTILSAVLLANNRYESILYVLCPFLLFLWKSWRTRTLRLSRTAPFTPLLLILPLLTFRVFQGDDRFIQTTRDNFFHLKHLGGNLEGAARFLFDPTGTYSNSVLISVLGTLALGLLGITLLRRIRDWASLSDPLATIAIVCLPMTVNTLLALSCYWGNWTDLTTSRFSLPLHLFLLLAIPLALRIALRRQGVPLALFVLASGFTLFVSGPYSKRLNNEHRLDLSVGYDWAIDWLQAREYHERSPIVLAHSVIGFGLYRQPTLPLVLANRMPERVIWTLDSGLYDEILIFQILRHNGQGGYAELNIFEPVNPRFILEPVARSFIDIHTIAVLSRVKGLRTGDATKQSEKASTPSPPPSGLTPDSLRDYLLEQLPLASESIAPAPAHSVSSSGTESKP